MNEKEETKAMSRLLTRGAKMLQKGCDDCGNPLFRYRGEVVCPVCNERRRAEDEEESDSGAGAARETEAEKGEDAGNTRTADAVRDAPENTEKPDETGKREAATDGDVDEHIRDLAEKLASDAVEHADDPEAVERRLDALERALGLLRR